MKRGLTIAWLLLLASVPLWLDDLYVLHVLIITGIFIIAAMSLNLLLGYTGQLSLGHVAFFGIGAYTSSLASLGFSVHLLPNWQVRLEPKPVWFGMLLGMVVAGLCGWAIGRISFKVRGAYFVIVTVSFAEVIRLVALNWVELTQGPMALNNIPYLALGIPGWFELSFLRKPANYWLVLTVAVLSYIVIRRLVHSRAGRAMIALRENEPLAASVGVDVTRYLVLRHDSVRRHRRGRWHALRPLRAHRRSRRVSLHLHGDHGDHGGNGRQGYAGRTGGRRYHLRPAAGDLAHLRDPPEAQWVVYGVLMILVVYFLPEGIVPAVRNWWQGRQQAQPHPRVDRTPWRQPVTAHAQTRNLSSTASPSASAVSPPSTA